ncbi:MAG: pyrroline-5-carboxylate reductase [Neisseriaceae bacterium]
MKLFDKIYFLGGGNMAEALIRSVEDTPYFKHIVVIEKVENRRKALIQRYPNLKVQAYLEDVVRSEDVLLIAVKPQDSAQALRHLKIQHPLVLSIVAGLSISILKHQLQLKDTSRIIRVMPNLPCIIKEGIHGLYAEPGLMKKDKVIVEELLNHSGSCLWVVSEEALHVVTAISGSGPGYVFFFMNALLQAAKQLKLEPSEARKLIEKTLLGATKLAQVTPDCTLEELQQKVTSPQGTTHAALQVFEGYDMASIIKKGIHASADRSKAITEELENSLSTTQMTQPSLKNTS